MQVYTDMPAVRLDLAEVILEWALGFKATSIARMFEKVGLRVSGSNTSGIGDSVARLLVTCSLHGL